MSYGNESLFGMPIYGELPLHIHLAMLWALAWVAICAVCFFRLRSRCSPVLLAAGFVVYATLGLGTLRLQFTHVPLKAVPIALLLTVVSSGLAFLALSVLLRSIARRRLMLAAVGIPALTVPVLLGVYGWASSFENTAVEQAQARLKVFQRLLIEYHSDTGSYPPEETWVEALRLRAKSHGWYTDMDRWTKVDRWREFRYCKPGTKTPADTVIAFVSIEAGKVVPAQRVSITLDGHIQRRIEAP